MENIVFMVIVDGGSESGTPANWLADKFSNALERGVEVEYGLYFAALKHNITAYTTRVLEVTPATYNNYENLMRKIGQMSLTDKDSAYSLGLFDFQPSSDNICLPLMHTDFFHQGKMVNNTLAELHDKLSE